MASKKITITIDEKIDDLLNRFCEEFDLKKSTKINSLIKNELIKEGYLV